MATEGVMRALRAAAELVNTMPDINGEEGLEGLDAVRAFMRRYIINYPRPLGPRDLDELRQMRTGLRTLFETKSMEEGAARVNALLPRARFAPILANHDGLGWHLHQGPEDANIAERLCGDFSMAAALMIVESDWSRLGRCAREGCNRVFLDETRNRSRRLCDSPVCGNRMHVNAYRARKRLMKGAAE